jgi:hypothetical protein
MSRKAIQAEGIAEARGIQEMNNALVGSGDEAIVKLRSPRRLRESVSCCCLYQRVG